MDQTRLRALLAARYAWLIVCAGRSAVVLAVGAQLMAPGPWPAMAQEVNGIYGVGFVCDHVLAELKQLLPDFFPDLIDRR
jgi:hypothetical protein